MTDIIQLELPFQETAITGYVYTLTFPGGYVYVGSTTQDLMKRIGNHIYDIRAGKGCPKLTAAAKHFGLEQSVSPYTGYKRWRFTSCTIDFKKYRVADRKTLYQYEKEKIATIPERVRLNERAPIRDVQENDFSTPVSVQVWVDMLYPEQASVEIAA